MGMSSHARRRSFLGETATAALIALASAQGVSAQVAAPEQDTEASTAIGDIVVTATKRATKLQDLPESIKVIDSVQLENSNVQNLRGFVQLTPNLLVRETFRSNETFLTMRGISSAQGALPPVAFVVDGIQLGSNDFINQDLLDIERIEVLRGPQGALYGQGAIAGAINVVTKQPTNDLSINAKASYGNADTMRFAGSVGGAIVEDTLFAKVSGYYKRSDGLIRNNAGTRITPYEQGYVRGQLNYESGDFHGYLFGSYTKGNGNCCIQDIVNKRQNGVIVPGFRTLTGAYTLVDVDDVTGNPGPTSNVLGKSWERFRNAGLKLEYDFDPFSVSLVSGYNYVRQRIYGDADYTAPSAGITQLVQDIPFTTRVFNQELRVTSRDTGPFKWLIGAFYQKRREVQDIAVGLDPGAPLNQRPGSISTFVLRQNNVTRSTSYAFYANASYDITNRLQLSGAFRYDRDRQSAVNTLAAGSNKAHTFTQPQPKVQLSYKFNKDLLVYSSYSIGFRSGGYSQNSAFDNELTKNYEIGFKSTLFDGAAVLNAAIFHIDYQNQQISFVQLQPVVLRQVVNIDKTGIDGLEVELTAKPTENLTVSAGVGVVNTTIEAISANALTTGLDLNALIGNKSPLVPPITLNGSIDYVMPLSDNYSLLFHGDYRREGGYNFDLANTIRTGTQDLINGKIALQTGRWQAGIWANNLTNNRYATNVGVTGIPYRYPNQPRSYGVELSFKL
ncbi:TonB-dependent receptor [Sphingomonas crocodyli]|uniref:TonB-dependent receptor n=1 Tax=Sphingomonas crocodyli TaxID=1979270 RepID=A0A437M6X4_9SPHN|nr:TonB-dependent receptor [Sphingomonas crocodyli]